MQSEDVRMMKFFKVSVLFMGLMLVANTVAAASDIETRIVGGIEVPNSSKYPWMVMLSETTSKSDFFCGASLISEQWILTAAHCVNDTTAGAVFAFIGEYNKTTSTVTASSISEIYVHPDYDAFTSDNDIALLKLTVPETVVIPVNIISTAIAATLEGLVDDINDIADVTVIGWGDTEDPVSPTYPNILREVDLPYISNSVCNQPASLNGQVTENMMCAGLASGGIDSCQGDSGGPLVFSDAGEWYQAGVVSWGAGCAEPNKYGVYTRVEKYSDWLDLMTNGVTIKPSVDMGTWIPGLTASYDLSIKNDASNAAFTINSFTLVGSNFTIVSDTCGGTVSANETCMVKLEFPAASLGDFTDTLTINTSLGAFPAIDIPLSVSVVSEKFFNNIVEVPSSFKWAVTGSADWSEEQVTTDGGFSFQSGNISDNQRSSLFAYENVPSGVVSKSYMFDWKVCSEEDYDFLELWVDNVKKYGISGDVDWDRKSITLNGEGDHVIEWRFNKDYNISEGQDAGWIDNIVLGISGYFLPTSKVACTPPVIGGGGGSMSALFYLGLVFPLLLRRRMSKKLH